VYLLGRGHGDLAVTIEQPPHFDDRQADDVAVSVEPERVPLWRLLAIGCSLALADVPLQHITLERSVGRRPERVLARHPTIGVLVNNMGHSIRRSLALSYEHYHHIERTMQLNYFAPLKLIPGALPPQA